MDKIRFLEYFLMYLLLTWLAVSFWNSRRGQVPPLAPMWTPMPPFGDVIPQLSYVLINKFKVLLTVSALTSSHWRPSWPSLKPSSANATNECKGSQTTTTATTATAATTTITRLSPSPKDRASPWQILWPSKALDTCLEKLRFRTNNIYTMRKKTKIEMWDIFSILQNATAFWTFCVRIFLWHEIRKKC